MPSWEADEAATLMPSSGLLGEIATKPEGLSQQHGW